MSSFNILTVLRYRSRLQGGLHSPFPKTSIFLPSKLSFSTDFSPQSLPPSSSPGSPSKGLLDCRTALITGASRGIGAAIAERFASEGAKCILLGRNQEALQEARNKLSDISKGIHQTMVGDVSLVGFWREVAKSHANVDILVNAAGITHYSPLFVTSTELLDKLVGTNLMGTMLGCQIVGKGMMTRKPRGGCIINIASLLGLKGGKGSAGYAASKAGVIGLTRALAEEVGKVDIRVNVIIPGYIETDMTAAMTPKARLEAINAVPLKRFGEAAEIADAAVFLATNKYANNCVLNLDGGLSAT